MKEIVYIIVFLGFLIIPVPTHAQEEKEIEVEESAEVYLEEYSDDFQESFFEALKQKGIENYDKAINLLLECKKLDDKNIVVDHELARAYLANKQYILARDYGVSTVVSEPENPWYLNTLVEVLQKQGGSINEVKSNIPFENDKLKENLALLYFRQKKYRAALSVLKEAKTSTFTKDLVAKINDSILQQKEKNTERLSFSTNVTNAEPASEMELYKTRIKGLLFGNNFLSLDQIATQALESYPSQPYFYYAKGYALNKKKKYRDAIEVLETALDYLLDDISLSNKIYQELVEAYTGQNNTVKANMYLRKIKPGF